MSLDWECKSDRLVCKIIIWNERLYICLTSERWCYSLRLEIPTFKCCGSSWQKLLIGTADGGIKAWNVDAKRVVCDLKTSEAFPRSSLKSLLCVCSSNVWLCLLPSVFCCSVLDVKCSPVEPIFVSAAASRGYVFSLIWLMVGFNISKRCAWPKIWTLS